MNVFKLSCLPRQVARIPLTLFVGVSALAVALFPSSSEILQYHRASISAGELWRLATCHLTHWNIEHFQWDFVVFVVLGAVCELRSPHKMRFAVGLGAMAVTGVVSSFFPGVREYRGLSGIDTALFTLLAYDLFRDAIRMRNRPQLVAIGGLILGFGAKTAYEATVGQTMFVDHGAAGFVPLVWDHVAGTAAGAIAAFVFDGRQMAKGSAAQPAWKVS